MLGRGGRGLLNYISQLSKAPIHRPQNNFQIYGRIHQPNPNRHPARRSQPAAGINQLPHLHELDVVHEGGYNAADRDRKPARSKSDRELLLQGHAHADLDGRAATDADDLRRPSHWPGTTSVEKGGRRRIEEAAAPPTFSTFAGTTPRQIAKEFGALRRLKPNLGKAVAHLILSPGPGDRVLSKDEWRTALEVALAEHGAADTPHAAYLHDDTHHQHLHVFFSRVTPAGDVISDSHSYQKNRSASKKITQELQLTPLPTTPNPTAPGDRTALDNAVRSAERRGEAQVNASLVRSALDQSRTLAEFNLNLRAVGIEAKFPTRGARAEIFGISLRPVGSDTWLKASTLAKDLSWPKIAHHFPESDRFAVADSAEQISTAHGVEAKQSEPVVPRPTRDDRDRMPGIAKSVLAPAPVVNEPTEETETTLDGINRRLGQLAEQQVSPLVLTGLVVAKLGVMCLQLSAAAARALWAFIQRLLAAFGIGVREVQVTTPAAPLQLATMVTPSQGSTPVLPQPYLLPQAHTIDTSGSVDSVAAATLEHVLDCVQTGRLSDLPKIGDGQENERAALVSALEDDSTVTSGVVGAGAGAAAAPGATPVPDPYEPLFSAINAYTIAKQVRDGAAKVESVEVRNARVRVGMANQNLLKSQTRFQREHPNLFLLGRMKKHTVGETEAVAEAHRAFERAKVEFPPAPDITLVEDVNRKGMAFLSLARKAVQHLTNQQSLIRDEKIAKHAASSIARLQKTVTEFKNGNGEKAISAMAERSIAEVNKFVEDDRSQARRKEINARLAAAAAESIAAVDVDAAGADDDEEPPKG